MPEPVVAAIPDYQTETFAECADRPWRIRTGFLDRVHAESCVTPAILLERLCSLESPRNGWELILVDRASTDSTGDVIARFASGAPFPVRHLRATAPSLTGAKNAAIAMPTRCSENTSGAASCSTIRAMHESLSETSSEQ